MNRTDGTVLQRINGLREIRAHWSKKHPGRLVIQGWERKADDSWHQVARPVALDADGQLALVEMISFAQRALTVRDDGSIYFFPHGWSVPCPKCGGMTLGDGRCLSACATTEAA